MSRRNPKVRIVGTEHRDRWQREKIDPLIERYRKEKTRRGTVGGHTEIPRGGDDMGIATSLAEIQRDEEAKRWKRAAAAATLEPTSSLASTQRFETQTGSEATTETQSRGISRLSQKIASKLAVGRGHGRRNQRVTNMGGRGTGQLPTPVSLEEYARKALDAATTRISDSLRSSTHPSHDVLVPRPQKQRPTTHEIIEISSDDRTPKKETKTDHPRNHRNIE